MNNYNKVLAKEAIKQIIPEKIYTKQEIVKFDLIPWSKHEQTVRRILERGALKGKFFEAEHAVNNRWEIKGSDIVEYLKTFSGKK